MVLGHRRGEGGRGVRSFLSILRGGAKDLHEQLGGVREILDERAQVLNEIENEQDSVKQELAKVGSRQVRFALLRGDICELKRLYAVREHALKRYEEIEQTRLQQQEDLDRAKVHYDLASEELQEIERQHKQVSRLAEVRDSATQLHRELVIEAADSGGET